MTTTRDKVALAAIVAEQVVSFRDGAIVHVPQLVDPSSGLRIH
jgi:hypothetical protein